MSLFKNKYRVETTRLQNWNYGRNGKYFVTIVTKNREHYFGKIGNKKMQFTEIGGITDKYWHEIPEHFPFVVLDEFCVMPNHIHGIVVIDNKTGFGIIYGTTRKIGILINLICEVKNAQKKNVERKIARQQRSAEG